ncbi:MAG: stage II sporulation protein R [Clostridia bacterium]|nr:stage II sporulation protein R [Clostridia bacterium]
MLRPLICTLMLLQTLCTGLNEPSFRTYTAMKTGVLLRLHVIAQDDTDAMQALKLTVRDAVQETFAALPRDPADTMLVSAQKVLPALTQAARDSAAAQGFEGSVAVELGWFDFDRRELDGLSLPADRYPALVIRLGEARGRNWWGVLDPSGAAACAALPGEEGWDWSFEGFLAALRQFMLNGGEYVG